MPNTPEGPWEEEMNEAISTYSTRDKVIATETRVRAIETTLARVEGKVDTLTDALNQGRGARSALQFGAGLAGGTIGAKILAALGLLGSKP